MSATVRMFHGGVPGLRVGDLLVGGHKRKFHDGCQYCADREAGKTTGIDPASTHPDRVYMTGDRDYARFHASMFGLGDLYRVEPVGETWVSTEDRPEWGAITAETARVTAVLDRAVRLTDRQRRTLTNRWARYDRANGYFS